jgi:integrase
MESEHWQAVKAEGELSLQPSRSRYVCLATEPVALAKAMRTGPCVVPSAACARGNTMGSTPSTSRFNARRFVHNLRQYFATALFRAGVNPRVAQELLGHADLTTTMRYAHVEAHDLKSGIARLETFVARHSPEEPPPESGARPLERPRKNVA